MTKALYDNSLQTRINNIMQQQPADYWLITIIETMSQLNTRLLLQSAL